jgi:hypothetical protein
MSRQTMASKRTKKKAASNLKELFESYQSFLSEQEEARKLSMQLNSYIRFRAEKEGVKYELRPEFFESGIMVGRVSGFFGVHFADGELVDDEQFPEIFKQWQEQKHELE